MNADNQFHYINSQADSQFLLLDAKMSDFSYSKHAHEEYSIGVTLSGRQDFVCDNRLYQSPVGGVIVFNPEDVHDGHAGTREHLEYVMLYIHPDELRPLFRALGLPRQALPRVHTPLLHDPVLLRQVLHLKQLSQCPKTTLETEHALLGIAHSLTRHAGWHTDDGLSYTRTDTLLLRARDYIAMHLVQDISVDEIAAAANLSKYHFIRLFRQQFGMTPHQYVINARVHLARKYIELGLSASRVAFDTGFADNSHLNRHFKRVFGITPTQYQRQRRT